MKHPRRRETLSKGPTKSGYARFDSWKDSVDDYVLWYNLNSPKDNEDFADFIIRRRYHMTDHNAYMRKINGIRLPICD